MAPIYRIKSGNAADRYTLERLGEDFQVVGTVFNCASSTSVYPIKKSFLSQLHLGFSFVLGSEGPVYVLQRKGFRHCRCAKADQPAEPMSSFTRVYPV